MDIEHEKQGPTLQNYIKKLDTIVVKGVKLTDLHKYRGTMLGEVIDNARESVELGQEEGGVFENVAEHTTMAMLLTDVLGERFGLSEAERADLNMAAWVHDSGKKTERMWQKSD